MSVYFIRSEGQIKIGYSASVEKRVSAQIKKLPAGAEYLGYLPGDRSVEAHFHYLFRKQREMGEWFEDSPRLSAMISDLALPHYPGAEYGNITEKLRHMDQTFAAEASDALCQIIFEIEGNDVPRPRIAEMMAPALGLSISRFLAILDCETPSVSAAEYAQIMQGIDVAAAVRRQERSLMDDAETMSPVPLSPTPSDKEQTE